MTKAIIFDMDGTLFQTDLILERALEATFHMLREKGLWDGPTPLKVYQKIMGVPLSVVWQTLCPNHSSEVHESSNDYFQEALIGLIKQKRGALYDDVESTLEVLSQEYTLFIASNGVTDYLQAIVETYELHKFVTKTYSIDLIANGSKTDLVRLIKEENEIVFGYVVGDRISDFAAGSGNDLTSIGVKFDYAQEKELQQADIVVERFEELIDVIKKTALV
ncbi:HAD hydrolase-like protein [Mangrovibacillus cuniculi]|uniref:HAD hydrolase-like protein n=1 Tax=Mangrovibacillus cuniculi TaxID=2593652 RepID=A0A7S8C9T0_9BACI|nr:HAD hydrolase-like protein [Mangrovibacillus cuniculi]QPC45896.1 HAD hydrolase-like protein [Mangrovibacillus cuniculi]